MAGGEWEQWPRAAAVAATTGAGPGPGRAAEAGEGPRLSARRGGKQEEGVEERGAAAGTIGQGRVALRRARPRLGWGRLTAMAAPAPRRRLPSPGARRLCQAVGGGSGLRRRAVPPLTAAASIPRRRRERRVGGCAGRLLRTWALPVGPRWRGRCRGRAGPPDLPSPAAHLLGPRPAGNKGRQRAAAL